MKLKIDGRYPALDSDQLSLQGALVSLFNCRQGLYREGFSSMQPGFEIFMGVTREKIYGTFKLKNGAELDKRSIHITEANNFDSIILNLIENEAIFTPGEYAGDKVMHTDMINASQENRDSPYYFVRLTIVDTTRKKARGINKLFSSRGKSFAVTYDLTVNSTTVGNSEKKAVDDYARVVQSSLAEPYDNIKKQIERLLP